jgi:hypothetical protein
VLVFITSSQMSSSSSSAAHTDTDPDALTSTSFDQTALLQGRWSSFDDMLTEVQSHGRRHGFKVKHLGKRAAIM